VLSPQILLVLSKQTRFGLVVFLVRRWMRTIPAYFVVLVFVSVLFGAAGSSDFWRYLSYTQNLLGQHVANDYYPVAWSLSVEEWFYLVFPAFLLAVSMGRARSSSFYAGVALAFVMIIVVGRQSCGSASAWGPNVRRVVVFRIDSIAWGFLLYLALARWPNLVRLPNVMGALAAILTAAILLVIEWTETSRLAQYAFPFISAAFGASYICLFIGLRQLFERGVGCRISNIAGKISYPFYLYHLLVIYLLAGAAMPIVMRLTLFCIGTGVLAGGNYYFIEQPILAARPHYRRKELKTCANDSFSASA
jgi:peptidoglycan/LPS O-acetylase OafA/YrhL